MMLPDLPDLDAQLDALPAGARAQAEKELEAARAEISASPFGQQIERFAATVCAALPDDTIDPATKGEALITLTAGQTLLATRVAQKFAERVQVLRARWRAAPQN